MMAWYLAWVVFIVVGAVLGFVGYHFSVRSVRWVASIAAIGLAITVSAYGLRHTSPAPSNLASAFALGADQVAAALFRPFGVGSSVPPGRVGWGAIIALLVLGYRALEWWALRWQAPMLDTSKLDEGQPSIRPDDASAGSLVDGLTDGQRHDLLAAEVRFRLAAMEVRAPAILPGGSRSGGLATIAETSGISGAGLAGAIIRFFGMLWPTPRQVQLQVWVEPPAAPASQRSHPRADLTRADPTRVTVELSDPRNGATLSTQTLAAASLDEAAVRVAGYVARQIFGMDPATPPWVYGAPDGEDLSALLLSRQQRVSIETPDDLRASRAEEIALLRKVAEASLCAGVVRYDLAQLYSLQGLPYEDHLTALRLHAVNRDQYPRFYRGRYRLAMSLEMVADPQFSFPNRAEGRDELSGTLNVLHRSRLTISRRCQDDDIQPAAAGDAWQLTPALRLELLTAAALELRGLRRQLTLPHLLWSTFVHRDERGIWRPYYAGVRLRQSFHDGVCVAELLVAARLRATEATIAAALAGGTELPPPPTRRHLRLGVRVAAAIAGRDNLMTTIPRRPGDGNARGPWPPAPEQTAIPASIHSARRRAGAPPPHEARDRVRWLPWQRQTASWQAAYNTACLYAALISHRQATGPDSSAEEQAWEDRVVISLERVADNPHAEMRRPWDVIAKDPDFGVLRDNPEQFHAFAAFLADQRRKDYPDAPTVARPTLTSVEPA
jgi:hypothetical protein